MTTCPTPLLAIVPTHNSSQTCVVFLSTSTTDPFKHLVARNFPISVSVNVSSTLTKSEHWHHLSAIDYTGLVNPHWRKHLPLPYTAHVIIGVFVLVIALISLVGNGLVLWLVFRFRSLRTSSNLFIISLAFADILMSVIDFPLFAAASFRGYWYFGYSVCQLYAATTGVSGLVNINTLAAISYDRYTVVVRRMTPVHHVSKQMTLLFIAAIWLSALFWIAAPLLGWSSFTLEGIGTTCTFDYLTRDAKTRSYVLMLMMANFGVPLVVVVFSYSRILMSVTSVRRGLMHCSPHISVGTQRQHFKLYAEMKTVTTIFTIVCVFCISWTPYVIVALIGLFGDADLVTPLTSAIPCILAKAATVSNPPLYSLGHPKFRKKLRLLLRSSSRRGMSGQTNSPPTSQDNHQVYL